MQAEKSLPKKLKNNSFISRSFAFKEPLIEKVSFRGETMKVSLADGRIVIVPLRTFPEIQKLTPAQRRKYSTLTGYGLMFEDIDDIVFHVSDFLGRHNTVGL